MSFIKPEQAYSLLEFTNCIITCPCYNTVCDYVDLIVSQSKDKHEFYIHPYLNVSERQIITNDILSFVSHAPINNTKELIIIKIHGKINNNFDLELKQLLEKYSINATFIFVTTQYSNIPKIIGNMCIHIRIPGTNKSIKNQVDIPLKQYLYEFLVDKKKTLQQVCAKMNSSGILVSEICKAIVEISMDKITKTEKLHDIISLLAEFDIKSKVINKEWFAFQHYLNQIYNIFNNTN